MRQPLISTTIRRGALFFNTKNSFVNYSENVKQYICTQKSKSIASNSQTRVILSDFCCRECLQDIAEEQQFRNLNPHPSHVDQLTIT